MICQLKSGIICQRSVTILQWKHNLPDKIWNHLSVENKDVEIEA